MAATVAQVVYGITLEHVDDKYFQMVKQITDIGEEITVPGRFLVEAFPVLQYVPSWFPGASFQKLARYYRDLGVPMRNKPFDAVKESMV